MELKWLITSVACALFFYGLNAQENQPGMWGIEIGFPGPAVQYSTVSANTWFFLNEKYDLSLEAGYGGRGHMTLENDIDPVYQGSTHRYFGTAQLLRKVSCGYDHMIFIGAGPYYHSITAALGEGFVYHLPEGALTAHSGADFQLRRLGLLPTMGMRIFIGKAIFGARMHIPVVHTKTDFSNLQNPILVKDFVPRKIKSYQQHVSRMQVRWAFSLHLGILFNGKVTGD